MAKTQRQNVGWAIQGQGKGVYGALKEVWGYQEDFESQAEQRTYGFEGGKGQICFWQRFQANWSGQGEEV